MGGDEHRRAVFGDVLHDERPDLAAHDWVQPVHGLVQDHELRPHGDGQPEGGLLEHAARKTAHGLLQVEAEDLAQLFKAPLIEAGINAPVKTHHVQYGGLGEMEDLVRDAENAPLDGGVFKDGLAVGQHFARFRFQNPGQALHGRRLACAVRPHKAVDLAGGGVHRQPVERAVAVVAFAHLPEFSSHPAPPPSALCARRARPP